jgi:RNA polymerase sigma-70 factor (ECF subfamily)
VSGQTLGVRAAIVAHLDAAHNLASWLMGSGHDAQDIVQEACLRAIRSAADYRGGNARSWLLTIVRNACFDRLRRERASPFEDAGDEPPEQAASETADPGAILQRAEDVARVRAELTRLPAVLREAVVLREMEGLSYREIAAISNVPLGTVMSRISRGRLALAQSLSEEAPASAKKPERQSQVR